MTTPPTYREVWQRLLDEAGEDAIESVTRLSPAEVEEQLAAHGFEPDAERAQADAFLEDLAAGRIEERAAGAAAEAAHEAVVAGGVVAKPEVAANPEKPQSRTPPERRRPRTAMALLIAATSAAAGGAVVYGSMAGGTVGAPAPDDAALAKAADWRTKAAAACDAKDWPRCLAALDEARALDPAGDGTTAVKARREQAMRGILGER
jgi:hypothetical protein